MKRGSGVGRERLRESEASALAQITALVRTTGTILHIASRIEAHEKTGADLCPMVGDQPSMSATSRFNVLQYSGARRSAREYGLDLCWLATAADDAETTQAAAGQAKGNRRPGRIGPGPVDQKVTNG